jgi:hypothetical protein
LPLTVSRCGRKSGGGCSPPLRPYAVGHLLLPASALGSRWLLLLPAALHGVRWLLMLRSLVRSGWQLLLLLGSAALDSCPLLLALLLTGACWCPVGRR